MNKRIPLRRLPKREMKRVKARALKQAVADIRRRYGQAAIRKGWRIVPTADKDKEQEK